MKKLLLILSAAFLFWLPGSISQQVTITGEDVCAHPDSTASVGITIDNFSGMFSAQYAIIYDPAVLAFMNVGAAPDFGPGNSTAFIFLFAPGEIRFSWFDSSVPFGDPSATISFTLVFDVIGSSGSMSSISFPTTSPTGFQMQFVKLSGVVPNGDIIRNPGSVTADNTPPVITDCPSNISDTLYNGQTSKMVSWTAPGATDNCELESFVSTHSPGGVFMLGATPVTYTATDEAGNTATCQFSINLVAAPVSDSLTFTAVGGTIACDDTIKVPVTVLNFDMMQGVQFGLTWDTTVLTFVDFADNLNASGYPSAFYNDDSIAVGKFKFSWLDVTFPFGQSLANGDTLFCLRFVLTNPFVAAVSDTISFAAFPSDNPSFPIEAVDNNGIIPNNSIDFNPAIVTAVAATVTCPPAINTSTNTDCTATGLDLGTLVFSGNCPPSGFVVTNDAPAAFPKGITTVTWTAVDVASNTATCTQIVTVNDNHLPTITCPANATVVAAPGQCSAVATYLAPVGTDNCPMPTTTQTAGLPSGADFPKGVTTNTFTVTDMAGNSAACSFTVTIADNEPPAITCPADISVNTDAGQCLAVVNYTAPVGTDNCPMATTSQTAGLASGADFPKGVTTNTFTVTDMANNTASCSFTVTVTDNELPMITCPADITVNTDAGQCAAVVSYASPIGTDNCPMSTIMLTAGFLSGASFPKGTTTNTFTVTDMSGNTATCSFTVMVTDDELPVLTCPADVTVQAPGSMTSAVVNGIALPSAVDNCGATAFSFEFNGVTTGTFPGDDASGMSFNLGLTTVTYTAADAAGNTASCTFDVTVEPSAVLTLTCPPDVFEINDTTECSAIVNGLALTVTPPEEVQTVFYEMTGATIGVDSGDVSGAAFNVGLTTVTYTAVNFAQDSFTCSFTVEVEDNEPPVFSSCPGDITVGNTLGACGVKFEDPIFPLATDNCPGVTVVHSHTAGSLLPVGQHTISSVATDAAGLTATCAFTLTVIDDEAPDIANCPDNLVRPADPGNCNAVVTWQEPIATDNCTLLAFTPSQGPNTLFNVGVTPVEYVAVDIFGNVSKCQFTVTVQDNQLPAFTLCPGNITQPAAPGECRAAVTWPQPVAADNCGVVSLSSDFQPNSFFDVGSHTVTYKATDAAGNMGTCAFSVTVQDTQFPLLSGSLPNLTVNAGAGQCGAVVSWTVPLVSDNCGIALFSHTATPGSFFSVGTRVVQYVALDVNGNTTVKNFTVTVIDNQLPTINCPEDVVVSTDGTVFSDPSGFLTDAAFVNCENIQLFFPAIAAADNCGIAVFTQTQGLASGSSFPVGDNTFVYAATDVHGNQSACSFDITVLPVDEVVAGAFPTNPCEGDEVFFFVNEYEGASYFWVGPEGDTVATGPFFTLEGIAASESGNYTVLIALPSNCDLESSVGIEVNKNPEVQASANDLLCMGGNADLNLTAASLNNVAVVGWVWQYPNGSFVLEQNPVVPNATIADAGTYTVTGISDNGCIGSASKEVAISNEPMKPILFGTENEVCTGEQIVLNGQVFFGNSVGYHWFAVPATGSGLTTLDNPILSVHPTEAGTYTYFFAAEVDGCQSDTAEWVVTVQAAPVLSVSVSEETTCLPGNTPITLMSSGAGSATCQWTGLNTGFSSSEPNPVIPNVTAAKSDIYRLVCTTTFGCQSTASVNVQITDQPPAPQLVASDSSLCTGAATTLSAFPAYGPGAAFLWTGPNLPPSAPFVQSLNVTPAQAGDFTYTFQAVVDGCTSAQALVPVKVEDTPPVLISVSTDTKCLPGNMPVTLKSNSTGAVSWAWSNANGTVLSTLDSLTFNNASSANSGTYSVVARNGIGCEATGSYLLEVTDALPKVTATLLERPCEDGDLRLGATFIQGAAYLWKNVATFFANVQNPVIPNASPALNGNYSVTATKDGCTSTSDELAVKILTAPTAKPDEVGVIVNTAKTFDVVSNDALEPGAGYVINVIQQPMHGKVGNSGNGVFTYTPDAGFRETDRILYEICYEDCPDACAIALVTFVVRFPEDVCLITNLITPNDDGINDELVVSCLEVKSFPNNSLIVFNQWGDKVFDAAPYKNDWKGTYKGRDLPDGTYFYIFKRDHDTPAEKGFVMIYR